MLKRFQFPAFVFLAPRMPCVWQACDAAIAPRKKASVCKISPRHLQERICKHALTAKQMIAAYQKKSDCNKRNPYFWNKKHNQHPDCNPKHSKSTYSFHSPLRFYTIVVIIIPGFLTWPAIFKYTVGLKTGL